VKVNGKDFIEGVGIFSNNRSFLPARYQPPTVTSCMLHEYPCLVLLNTSEYATFTKKDGKKEREIYKLPFFPDRIAQWAVLQVIDCTSV